MNVQTAFGEWAKGVQSRLSSEYASSGSVLDHGVSLGTIRETVVRDILCAFLPASIEIGSGQIIDLQGALSKQVDIIITRTNAPAFRFQAGLSAYLNETVLAAVEVKSAGYEDKLNEALTNCRSVKKLASAVNVRGKGPTIFDEAFNWLNKSGGLAEVEARIHKPQIDRPLACPDETWFVLRFIRFWMHWEAGDFRCPEVLVHLQDCLATPEFDFFSHLLCFVLKDDDPARILAEGFPEAPKIKSAFFRQLYEFLFHDQLVPGTFVLAYRGYKNINEMVESVRAWFKQNLEETEWALMPRVIINDRMFMYRHYNEYHCARHEYPVIFLITGILDILAPELSWQIAPGGIAQINRYFNLETILGSRHPIYAEDYLVWSIPFDDSSEGTIKVMNPPQQDAVAPGTCTNPRLPVVQEE